jgi:hypothetical protein
MKYFTPELFVRGNSDEPDEVDRVEAEWERATKRYRRHYKKIETSLPLALRKFHDEQCLHDAEVVGPAQMSLYSLPFNRKDVVIVAQQTNTLVPEFVNTLAILQYAITADPVVERPVDSPVFKATRREWLYDEIDVVKPGVFQHEIFLSDGHVLRIRFCEFRYLIAPLLPLANGAAARQPATDPSVPT